MSHVQFQDKSGSSKRYTGIDQWCDADYNSQPPHNITPGPCLDMSIFVCEPFTRTLPPGVRAAIAVAAFIFMVIVLGIMAYFVLAKASKFRRYLALARIRLKGAPRSGRMSLVVTDIEGYSGRSSLQQLHAHNITSSSVAADAGYATQWWRAGLTKLLFVSPRCSQCGKPCVMCRVRCCCCRHLSWLS
jgi:hypothetical protein